VGSFADKLPLIQIRKVLKKIGATENKKGLFVPD
jgi:hypothetical protein